MFLSKAGQPEVRPFPLHLDATKFALLSVLFLLWWFAWKSEQNRYPKIKNSNFGWRASLKNMSLFKLPDMTALLSPSLVVSAPAQAVKFHKNFGHFKYSLWVNMKNILGKYSSFFGSSTWNYLHLHYINSYRNDHKPLPRCIHAW